MQAIQLSDHFTRKRLLRFSLPSIVMMVFTSIYGVNLIMPFLMILGGVGFMFGTGGGALIAKTMGEGKAEKADKLFSMTVYASILCGLVLTAVGLLFLRPFARLMGAEGELLENSLLYGTINLIALPFYILQYEFQCLFATAEKPKLGLYVTVASGVANMVLDWLLVAVLPFGLAGAAAATAASQFIGGVFPLIYFARKNSSRLPDPLPSGASPAGPYLRQRFLRADGQYLHVAGQYAV